MVKEVFASVLEDLGKIMNMRLAPDSHGACQIKSLTGLMVHMEPDTAGERIMIISDLGVPAPGRYRENLFREALKANGLPMPRQGIFSYSKKKDSLVLFDTLFMNELTAQKMSDFLTPFMQKADLWRQAIPKGEVPSFTGNELSFGATPSGSGMFGL
ncbi:MAG: CesT family type III secretion system chaperone [Chlamydiales bacterium]|nr:CesT family type III secretion system chaperone [Chlamydiales bacterium]